MPSARMVSDFVVAGPLMASMVFVQGFTARGAFLAEERLVKSGARKYLGVAGCVRSQELVVVLK
jgi:hypothetical protein